MVCEFEIHDVGKMLLHQLGHYFAERSRAQVLALLYHIVVGGYRRYRRRVGRRTAYALFLHRAYERRLRIAGGRLRELLIRHHLVEVHLLPLAETRQGIIYLRALFILCLLVYRRVAGEFHLGIICAESAARALRLYGDAVIYRVCHLACRKAAPDQAVQPVLLLRQILTQKLRRKIYIRGTYGLVRILRAGLGLEMAGCCRAVALSVARCDIRARRAERLVRKTQRVGTHVGDETHAALSAYLHALIELLRDGHGAARRHAEAARRLLLQRGGDERRRGRLLLFAALDGLYDERRALHRLYYLVDFGFAVQLRLFAALAVKARSKAAGILPAVEICVEKPVFLADEVLYLLFPVNHHARRNGLHTACGKSCLYLAPQKRRELVAHYSVEYSSCLLRVDQVLIYRARVPYAVSNDFFCDLVEGHPLCFLVVQPEQLLQVPRYGLALAVRVGRKIHGRRRLGFLLQLVYELALILHRDILRLEAVLQIHAHLALGQIPQMSH